MRSRGQTLKQRVAEVAEVVKKINAMIAAGKAQVKVGANGAIAFIGISNEERDGVTDACIYRRMMVSGSPLARQKIAMAEQLAGRAVDKRVLATGLHSHDGGITWGTH